MGAHVLGSKTTTCGALCLGIPRWSWWRNRRTASCIACAKGEFLSRSAMFGSSAAPVVDKSFAVSFNKSHGRRLSRWRWEKGGDAAGWTSLPVQRPSYAYTPTVADVGHRLRASIYYADRLGNRVKAITEPSEPVQAGVSEADRIIRSEYDVYLRGNKLTYENRNCIREDEYGTRFRLIVYSPASESGTPERDTLDFAWSASSWQYNGRLRHRAPASRQ